MDFEKISVDELYDIDFKKMLYNEGDAEDKFTESEKEVFEAISEHVDEYPITTYQKTNEELTELFGGHDDMVVTDNVREALFWECAVLGSMKATADMLNEIADGFDEDDEDEDEDDE